MREAIRQRLQPAAPIVRPQSVIDTGLEALRKAFAEQRPGQLKFFGLTLHRVSQATAQIGWHNSLTEQRGVLVRVSEGALLETTSALLAELARLRGGKQICLPL